MNLDDFITDVPDFPEEGVVFKDITPLLGNPEAYRESIDKMIEIAGESGGEKIAAVESRGFLFGSTMAYDMNIGHILVRKPGKLPREVERVTYELEYGEDTLEIHTDAVKQGEKIILVDDLLATGGTIEASIELIEKVGGEIAAVIFLIELEFLNGRDRISEYPVHSLLKY